MSPAGRSWWISSCPIEGGSASGCTIPSPKLLRSACVPFVPPGARDGLEGVVDGSDRAGEGHLRRRSAAARRTRCWSIGCSSIRLPEHWGPWVPRRGASEEIVRCVLPFPETTLRPPEESWMSISRDPLISLSGGGGSTHPVELLLSRVFAPRDAGCGNPTGRFAAVFGPLLGGPARCVGHPLCPFAPPPSPNSALGRLSGSSPRSVARAAPLHPSTRSPSCRARHGTNPRSVPRYVLLLASESSIDTCSCPCSERPKRGVYPSYLLTSGYGWTIRRGSAMRPASEL